MPIYKNLQSDEMVVRPFKMYKNWLFSDFSGNRFTTMEEYINSQTLRVFDARRITGSNTIDEIYPQILDTDEYVLTHNYTLLNGDRYLPYTEPYQSGSGIKVYDGTESILVDGYLFVPRAGYAEVIGIPSRNMWHSLNQLFYSTPGITGSNFQTIVNDEPYTASYTSSGFAAYYDEFKIKNFGDSAYVFDIPKRYYGDDISRNSFFLTCNYIDDRPYSSSGNTSTSMNIYDDGENSLYDSSFVTTHPIGNISYDKGLIIITDKEYYRYISSSFVSYGLSSGFFTLQFQSEYIVYEHEYICHVKANEFNMTSNVTAYDSNGIFKYEYNLTGSNINSSSGYFRPFVTAIGLYNSNSDLICVAKMAKPIRIEKDLDTTIIVKFDV